MMAKFNNFVNVFCQIEANHVKKIYEYTNEQTNKVHN